MNKKLSVHVRKVCGDHPAVRIYRYRTIKDYHVISVSSFSRLTRALNSCKADVATTIGQSYFSTTWYF